MPTTTILNPQGDLLREEQLSLRELIFRALWAASFIFHQVSYAGFPMTLSGKGIFSPALFDLIIDICAVAVLFNPRRSNFFNLMLLTGVAQCLYNLPDSPNHSQLSALVSGWILLHSLIVRRFPLISLRLATIVVYFYVTLHKLNWGFINPLNSCATTFGQHVLVLFPILNNYQQLLVVLPISVILAEGLLVILLSTGRFAHWGVFLGYLLHFFLGLDAEKKFFNFSAPMFALLFLFLTDEFFAKSQRHLEGHGILAPIIRLLMNPLFRVIVPLILIGMQFGMAPGNSEHIRLYCFEGIMLGWLFISTMLLMVVIHLAKKLPADRSPWSAISMREVGLPLIILLLGLGPYLGFRTRSALDMYSNLQVEEGRNNHFIMPSLNLFGFLTDTVEILETSDEYLRQQFILKELKMVGFEFDRYLSAHPETMVSYLRNGTNYTYPPTGGSSPAWLLKKLLWFRPVDSRTSPICQW